MSRSKGKGANEEYGPDIEGGYLDIPALTPDQLQSQLEDLKTIKLRQSKMQQIGIFFKMLDMHKRNYKEGELYYLDTAEGEKTVGLPWVSEDAIQKAIADYGNKYAPNDFGALIKGAELHFKIHGCNRDADLSSNLIILNGTYSILENFIEKSGIFQEEDLEVLLPSPTFGPYSPILETFGPQGKYSRKKNLKTFDIEFKDDGSVDIESFRRGIFNAVPIDPSSSPINSSRSSAEFEHNMDRPRSAPGSSRSRQESKYVKKLLILVNPNNPTGKYINRVDMKSMIEICYEYGIAIFIDEILINTALTEEGDFYESAASIIEEILLEKGEDDNKKFYYLVTSGIGKYAAKSSDPCSFGYSNPELVRKIIRDKSGVKRELTVKSYFNAYYVLYKVGQIEGENKSLDIEIAEENLKSLISSKQRVVSVNIELVMGYIESINKYLSEYFGEEKEYIKLENYNYTITGMLDFSGLKDKDFYQEDFNSGLKVAYFLMHECGIITIPCEACYMDGMQVRISLVEGEVLDKAFERLHNVIKNMVENSLSSSLILSSSTEKGNDQFRETNFSDIPGLYDAEVRRQYGLDNAGTDSNFSIGVSSSMESIISSSLLETDSDSAAEGTANEAAATAIVLGKEYIDGSVKGKGR